MYQFHILFHLYVYICIYFIIIIIILMKISQRHLSKQSSRTSYLFLYFHFNWFSWESSGGGRTQSHRAVGTAASKWEHPPLCLLLHNSLKNYTYHDNCIFSAFQIFKSNPGFWKGWLELEIGKLHHQQSLVNGHL